jgi:hypothetical protein
MDCGTCKACCTVFDIEDLAKPAGTPCKHLCEAGCGVYETRPSACRGYFCIWRDDKAVALGLPEWARPDRTGVILNARGGDLNRHFLIAFEVTPGASRAYWGERLMKWLVRHRFVVAVQTGKKVDRVLERVV